MKVFVSSTYEDLKEYRAAVREVIWRMKHDPIMMEQMLATTAPPKKECLDRVEEADMFIGIYAHRYGFIPRGDTSSITEQEYRHALSKGMEVYCFIVDGNFEWPAKLKEDSVQLQEFLKEVKRDRVVDWFKTPEDLALKVAQVLATVQQQRMSPWQEKARKIEDHQKLTIINDLVRQNNLGHLNDGAMKAITILIASDFRSIGPSTSLKLIDHTGELLDGSIRIEQFVYIANQLSQEANIRVRWVQRIRANARQIFWPVMISLFLGLVLGILSYRQNWFGVRVIYLAGKNADPMDVVQWLVRQSQEHTVLGDTSALNARIATVAIRFAYKLDPNNPEIRIFLDNLLANTRMFTRAPNASLETLKSNRMILEGYYNSVPYPLFRAEADSLRNRENRIVYSNEAKALFNRLRMQAQNPIVEHKILLAGYRTLLANYPHYEKADSVTKIILPSLLDDSTRFVNHLKMQASDTLTIIQQIKLWENFLPSTKVSYEKSYADSMKTRLDSLMAISAHLAAEMQLLTCDTVLTTTTKNCRREKNRFRPGEQVWAWARVITLKENDEVSFKWYVNGKEFGKITNNKVPQSQRPGYRTWATKIYGADSHGNNEVRLYNNRRILIGRKAFRVD